MAGKADVRVKSLGKWDDYSGRPPTETLELIYDSAMASSTAARDWYWKSIASKRRASRGIRILGFSLLALGAALPILAGVSTDPARSLLLTQLGVAALAVAGLTQAADRVFGWSSGWLRYITTVTTMENVTRAFQLDWAKSLLQAGPRDPTNDEVLALFAKAQDFEDHLTRLRFDETDRWVTEFNSGVAALRELIKNQRESVEEARVAAETHLIQAQSASKLGSVQVKLLQPAGPEPVMIGMDQDDLAEFLGSEWSHVGLTPGPHMIRVRATTEPPMEIRRAVDVPAGGKAFEEISI